MQFLVSFNRNEVKYYCFNHSTRENENNIESEIINITNKNYILDLIFINECFDTTRYGCSLKENFEYNVNLRYIKYYFDNVSEKINVSKVCNLIMGSVCDIDMGLSWHDNINKKYLKEELYDIFHKYDKDKVELIIKNIKILLLDRINEINNKVIYELKRSEYSCPLNLQLHKNMSKNIFDELEDINAGSNMIKTLSRYNFEHSTIEDLKQIKKNKNYDFTQSLHNKLIEEFQTIKNLRQRFCDLNYDEIEEQLYQLAHVETISKRIVTKAKSYSYYVFMDKAFDNIEFGKTTNNYNLKLINQQITEYNDINFYVFINIRFRILFLIKYYSEINSFITFCLSL